MRSYCTCEDWVNYIILFSLFVGFTFIFYPIHYSPVTVVNSGYRIFDYRCNKGDHHICYGVDLKYNSFSSNTTYICHMKVSNGFSSQNDAETNALSYPLGTVYHIYRKDNTHECNQYGVDNSGRMIAGLVFIGLAFWVILIYCYVKYLQWSQTISQQDMKSNLIKV